MERLELERLCVRFLLNLKRASISSILFGAGGLLCLAYGLLSSSAGVNGRELGIQGVEVPDDVPASLSSSAGPIEKVGGFVCGGSVREELLDTGREYDSGCSSVLGVEGPELCRGGEV